MKIRDNAHTNMIAKHPIKCFSNIFIIYLITIACAHASNPALVKRVRELSRQDDRANLIKLVDAEEVLWKQAPSMTYFRDMLSVGDVLIGGTSPQIYWLGRVALWNMLLKPVPNEDGAPQRFYENRYEMFVSDAEDITPYVDKLSPDMFESVRHDTFLMLAEYARQMHASIIAGYRDKYSGAANDLAAREHFMQNRIDNQIQAQVRKAISLLAEDHVDYLIEAYSHEPANEQELKELLDILNVQGADREKVLRDTK